MSQLIITNNTAGSAAVTGTITVGLSSMQILTETIGAGATKIVTFYNVIKLDSNATFTINADVEVVASAYLHMVVQ